MICIVFVMPFAVVLPLEGRICEVDTDLPFNINFPVPVSMAGGGGSNIGIFVLGHYSSDH